MKRTYFIVLFFVLAVALMPIAPAHAQTATTTPAIAALLEQLQSLLKQVQELQKQIAQTRTQIRETLRTDLHEGMSDEDIRRVQEILATDSSIYPEGLVTGYFGPLTRGALRRFQQRFELEVNGEINEETRQYLEELLQERFGDDVPPGLLRAPGIQKKVELRLKDGCDNSGRGTAPFCKKIKIKIEQDDDGDDISDDDSSSDDEMNDDDSDDTDDDSNDDSDDDSDDDSSDSDDSDSNNSGSSSN